MKLLFNQFRQDLSGALTFDWYFLTLGLFVLGLGALSVLFFSPEAAQNVTAFQTDVTEFAVPVASE